MESPIVFQVEGQQVMGVIHRPDSAPRGAMPGVLFLHGFTGSKHECHRLFVLLARRLVEAGMTVLRFDFRGSGDSAGDFSEVTISGECADARHAVSFLKAQGGVDPGRLGIVGMSLGGLIAARLLGEEHGFSAGVLLCPVADGAEAVNRESGLSAWGKMPGSDIIDRRGWPVGKRFVEELTDARPLDHIVKTKTPVLLVHGSEDELVPLDDSRAYQHTLQQVGSDVDLHIIDGANHTFASIPWSEEVMTRTVDWLQSYLLD